MRHCKGCRCAPKITRKRAREIAILMAYETRRQAVAR